MNYRDPAEVLAGKRIFVVEDDILNARVYHSGLARHGVFIFQDIFGYGIVQHIIDSLPIDLIFLDLKLKRGNDGYDIFDQLKADNQLMNIPVVAVTSLDPEVHIPIAKQKGFSGYLSKPINILELPQQLARILNGETLWLVSRY
jgi:two-component system, cell cycle response regulator DivK